MADTRRYSLTSCHDIPPAPDTRHPIYENPDDPSPGLLVEVDPDTPVVSRHDIRGESSFTHSLTDWPVPPGATNFALRIQSQSPTSRSTSPAEAAPPSVPLIPHRTHQERYREDLRQEAISACQTLAACPAAQPPDHSIQPGPIKLQAKRLRRASSPKPFTTLSDDTKRLLAYQRNESFSRKYQLSPSFHHDQSCRLESNVTPPLTDEATSMQPPSSSPSPTSSTSTSSSSPEVPTSSIHQLNPTALNALLDENTDPALVPQWLIFTIYGTSLSFSSSLPTKQARAVAALVGVTWRSIQSEENAGVSPPQVKHHLKATLHPVYEGGLLQSATFEVYGVFAAVARVQEKIIVAAVAADEFIHADTRRRRESKMALVGEKFPDEVAKLKELGVQDVDNVPDSAPTDVKELAGKVSEDGERLISKELGVGRLRVLELKVEAMAEELGEEMKGLRIPDGVY